MPAQLICLSQQTKQITPLSSLLQRLDRTRANITALENLERELIAAIAAFNGRGGGASRD
jgi:hypothetical protein